MPKNMIPQKLVVVFTCDTHGIMIICVIHRVPSTLYIHVYIHMYVRTYVHIVFTCVCVYVCA